MPVLSIYDFCDTLIDFQSANAFVNYVIHKNGSKSRFAEIFRKVLIRFHLLFLANIVYRHMSVNKALLLYQLKGYSKSELQRCAEDFYRDIIKPHLQKDLLNSLQNDISEECVVVIASGGYDIYLNLFCKEYNIHHLLCSSLVFDNDTFTGKVYTDCMGKKKKEMVLKYFDTRDLTKKFSKVIFYSDSESDIPLFLMSTERNVIVIDNDIPEWVHKIGANPVFR